MTQYQQGYEQCARDIFDIIERYRILYEEASKDKLKKLRECLNYHDRAWTLDMMIGNCREALKHDPFDNDEGYLKSDT